MRKRKAKPQAKRHCLRCGAPLSGYKLKYCDGRCQRAYQYRLKQRKAVTVSECCEADVRVTVRGNFCKKCDERTRLATIYAIPTDDLRESVRKQKERLIRRHS